MKKRASSLVRIFMKRRKSEGIFPSNSSDDGKTGRTRFSEKMLDLTVTPRSMKYNGTTLNYQYNKQNI